MISVLDYLRSIFARSARAAAVRPDSVATRNGSVVLVQTRPCEATEARLSGKAAVDEYFALAAAIEQAMRERDYQAAVSFAKKSFPLIPALVRLTKRQYGSWDISRSVAVDEASKLMLAYGDREGLESAAKHLRATRATVDWAEEVDECIAQLGIVDAILRAATETPGVVQVKLRKELAVEDGREFAHVCYWMERVGRLRREKKGSSYALFVT